MIIVLIIVTVIILLTLFVVWRFNCGLFLVIGVIAAVAIPTLVGRTISSSMPVTTEIRDQQTIVSVQDNTPAHGGIFVISSSDYFYYYARNDDGSYCLDKVSAEGTVIIEEDRSDGEIYTVMETKMSDSWVSAGLNTSNKIRTEIHVPHGSIVQKFVLDAQN